MSDLALPDFRHSESDVYFVLNQVPSGLPLQFCDCQRRWLRPQLWLDGHKKHEKSQKESGVLSRGLTLFVNLSFCASLFFLWPSPVDRQLRSGTISLPGLAGTG